MVLWFILRPTIYFWLIFCERSKVYVYKYLFLHVDVQFFQHILLKTLFFFIQLPFLFYQRSVDYFCVGTSCLFILYHLLVCLVFHQFNAEFIILAL